uniref:FrhB_FdhB_C domain-containing protein n=1 Tax=Heterorhabditis bacteriophora TaxID=37862 RepID=A0A1I7XDB5_HETBA
MRKRKELADLLTDFVSDCVSCPSSKILRDTETGDILGVCLAISEDLFEKVCYSV